MIKNTVTNSQIDEIVANSECEVYNFFGKCTVVAMKLPNGFVLVESSSCVGVDSKNYDSEIGVRSCKKRLENRIRELEGYRLQSKLYAESQPVKNFDDITVGEMIKRGFDVHINTYYDGQTTIHFEDSRV